MRLIVFLLLCTVLAACGDDDRVEPDAADVDAPMLDAPELDVPTDAPPPSVVPFKIVTWNVENFFNNRNDPGNGDDDYVFSFPEVQQKISNLAEVLREIDADFIAMQEVETEELLQQLVDDGLAGMGYTEVGLIDGFDARDVGFISRFPITNVVSHQGEAFDGPDGERQFFTRDALEVFINADGIELLVMVSHFISQRSRDNDARRLAEATQAQDLLRRRLLSMDRVLFAADVNDEPNSPPYNALTADDEVLVDLTLGIPSSDRWTFLFNGRDQLDYVMGSPAMMGDLVSASIPRGDAVVRTSDHFPVVAEFQLRP